MKIFKTLPKALAVLGIFAASAVFAPNAVSGGWSPDDPEPPTLGHRQMSQLLINDGFSFNGESFNVRGPRTLLPGTLWDSNRQSDTVKKSNTVKIRIYDPEEVFGMAEGKVEFSFGNGVDFPFPSLQPVITVSLGQLEGAGTIPVKKVEINDLAGYLDEGSVSASSKTRFCPAEGLAVLCLDVTLKYLFGSFSAHLPPMVPVIAPEMTITPTTHDGRSQGFEFVFTENAPHLGLKDAGYDSGKRVFDGGFEFNGEVLGSDISYNSYGPYGNTYRITTSNTLESHTDQVNTVKIRIYDNDLVIPMMEGKVKFAFGDSSYIYNPNLYNPEASITVSLGYLEGPGEILVKGIEMKNPSGYLEEGSVSAKSELVNCSPENMCMDVTLTYSVNTVFSHGTIAVNPITVTGRSYIFYFRGTHNNGDDCFDCKRIAIDTIILGFD